MSVIVRSLRCRIDMTGAPAAFFRAEVVRWTNGALRCNRGRSRSGRITAAFRLARAGARVLLLDRERFPRDKPCGGGLTYRAVRQLPFTVEPVVEDTVRHVRLGFRYERSIERHTEGPLILMTQRDASTRTWPTRQPQPARTSATAFARPGWRWTSTGDGALRRLGRDGSGRDRCGRGERPDRARARAPGKPCARRGARGQRRPCTRAQGLPRPGGRRARRRPGRLCVGLPERRSRQRRRRRLGVGGAALREHLERACSEYGVPAERLESVRGFRLPMRRPGDRARSGGCCSPATRPAWSTRSRATGCTRPSSSSQLAVECVLAATGSTTTSRR